jgi:ABC-2 type transport system permease protein/sodium transport system permease protein
MSHPSSFILHPSELGRLWRLTRKELSESLRDRRTLGTLVLMPILLYPLLAIAFVQLYQSNRMERARPAYRLGFASQAEAESLFRWWERGRQHMVRRHSPSSKKGDETVANYLQPLPELEPYLPPNLDEAVASGQVDAGVRLRPPGAFVADPSHLLFIECDVIYREGSSRGRDAVRHLEILTADANARLVGRGMQMMGIAQRGDPVRVHARELPEAPSTKKSTIMPVLVPLILILMTMTGAVYPAIDLTAGERERGTLEILVAAPVPRLLVLLAKYAAVFTVAMLTALVNLGSMTLTLRVTGIQEALFGTQLNALVLFQVLALLLLFAAFFSAVVLTLTSFARSFKEAQAYLIPLMLLCLTPGVMSLMPGLHLTGPLAVVPLLNIVLLARDLLAGTASLTAAFVVVTTTLVYALAAVSVAARFFGAEAVLSSDVSGWSDLFRRPSTPQSSVDLTSALVCLALMFPCYFLLMTGLGQIGWLDSADRLGLSVGVNLFLFVGFPLVFAWLGRVRLADTFRWRSPSWQACAAAVVLGVCLWPLVAEMVFWMHRAGTGGLGSDIQEKGKELIEQWREHSPVLIVMVMALVPAVVEELFFRGFLFTALLGSGERPERALLCSAALFAAFHLLVGAQLTVERFVPSFLLGVVLGWLCLKSGSVIPGMILHTLNNGLVVMVGLYQQQLAESGWLPTEDRLPGWLVGTAAAGVALGLAWVWGMRRQRASGQDQ